MSPPPDDGNRLAARLQTGLEARDAFQAQPSRFGDGMGWWAGRHEIVHFHDDHEIDDCAVGTRWRRYDCGTLAV